MDPPISTRSSFSSLPAQGKVLEGSLSEFVELDYVEVQPKCAGWDRRCPALTAAFIKLQLIHSTARALFLSGTVRPVDSEIRIQWSSTDPSPSSVVRSGALVTFVRSKGDGGEIEELLCFPTNDPAMIEHWPCQCQGFVLVDKLHQRHPQFRSNCDDRCAVVLSDSTLVRVLPPYHTEQCGCDQATAAVWRDQLTGDCAVMINPHGDTVNAVWKTQPTSTVANLTLRMQRLLLPDDGHTINIGTTANSFQNQRRKREERLARQRKIHTVLGSRYSPSPLCSPNKTDTTSRPTYHPTYSDASSLFCDGAILVHSPDHAAGKTALVKAIAVCRLVSNVALYVIRFEAMLARYGIHADTALQCTIHAIVVHAAVRQQPVCIVLDGLETVLPAMSNYDRGDASIPVLQGMASYIEKLATSLQQSREVPFPINNPLYNLNGNGDGIVVPVRLCLVAIMTCSDHRSDRQSVSAMGTFRLPDLSSTMRMSAFKWAFTKEGVEMSEELANKLPYLAASAVWARGATFQQIAQQLRRQSNTTAIKSGRIGIVASLEGAEIVFSRARKSMENGCNFQFLANGANGDLFDRVGGNVEAKIALEDALALDEGRQKLLASLGLTRTTGVLLYGPPGTGKTLLAKAIARTLRSQRMDVSTTVGGAFVSLSSVDIVCAEVGSSEKMLVAAFQTARANAPSVIFIDEFQALFTERSQSGSGRLSSTLLSCMDDLKKWTGIGHQEQSKEIDEDITRNRVLVLAATNTPWMIDHAFLRPGRFDRAVHVGLPIANERKAIMRLHVGRMNTEISGDSAKLDAFCHVIAAKTEGFSGADIAALCRAAAIRCLNEKALSVRELHFMAALDDGIKASNSQAVVERIKRWRP